MRCLVSFVLFTSVLSSACSPSEPAVPNSQAATATPAAMSKPPDAVSADASHYSILFENDIARLVRVKIPAGAKSVLHTHPSGCAIIVVGAMMKNTSDSNQTETVESKTGEVTCNDEYAHVPENIDSRELEVVLLELKNRKTFGNVQTGRNITIASKPGIADATSADPRHYATQFENDTVRLLRIKIPPGEKFPAHAHPAYCVVELSNYTAVEEGGSKPAEVKVGQAGCGDAMSHAGQVTSKTPAEVIVIEFKNRDVFKS